MLINCIIVLDDDNASYTLHFNTTLCYSCCAIYITIDIYLINYLLSMLKVLYCIQESLISM